MLSSGLNIVSFAECESGIDKVCGDVEIFLNKAFFKISLDESGFLTINNIEPWEKAKGIKIEIPEYILGLKVQGVKNCKNYGIDKITFKGEIDVIDSCEFEAKEIKFNSVNQMQNCNIINCNCLKFVNIDSITNCKIIDEEEVVFKGEIGTFNNCSIEAQLIVFENKINKIEKCRLDAEAIKFEDELKEIEDCNLKNIMLFAVPKNEAKSFIEKFLSVLPENYSFEFLKCDDELNYYALKVNLDKETQKEYDAFFSFLEELD